ncbi:pimeloyl-ACP methyl ester esterase BioH [Luteimonas sp. SX5]|uniref:Pimeloyl-[acyl-carrier protein] methyl ester esterase n=1 Tax=Luteimonas galliterrae TaxID=2940486 RepID=A0ABT0MMJ1_9GAMM|nr:pimeloyl-ACP methyl ester esterase BioH [Luteimonas galliterrae]
MSELHIEIAGDGPALVLIHGWAMHGGIFAPLVARLRDRYTLHLVDLPGHGYSHRDDTPLTLEACVAAIAARTPPAVWIGWSMGGLFALHAAATLPQVRGLAMVCATPRFVVDGGADGRPWPHAVSPDVFAQFARDLETDYRSTLDRFLVLDTIGAEHGREELRTLRQELFSRCEPAPRILQQGLTLLERSDLRDALPQLRVPSLWVSGRRDRLVPPAGMRDAAAMATDSTYLDIAGGGHAPFLGHADAVSQAIDEFASLLSRHSREGGNPATLNSDSGVGGRAQVTGFPPSRE